MKKNILLILLIFILSVQINFAEEIGFKKVNEYIKAIEGFINKYPDAIENEEESKNTESAVKSINEIVEKYKLNDDEVLEVLNIVTKEHDVHKIVNRSLGGDTSIQYDKDIDLKFMIFTITIGHYQRFPWKSLTAEEKLMNKILPILNKSKNPAVIRYYLIISDGMFRDIWNENLPMSYENKDKYSDKLIEIFTNENNSFDLRRLAIEVWTAVESREKECIDNFEYILKNEELFEKTADFLDNIGCKIEFREKTSGLSFDKHYRNIAIDNMMINILKKSELYSEKILNGVLVYFLGSVTRLSEDFKNKLLNIVYKKLKKETKQDLRKKYENIIRYSNEKE